MLTLHLSHFVLILFLIKYKFAIVKRNNNTLEFFAKIPKYKIDSFTSLIMKSIVIFPAQSRFLGKIIYCIDFGSTPRVCCSLKSISIDL